ncbi:Signal transduction histidine kinase [Dehalogenimonas alkenigignens]|uniref:histidine kinase n=1 Tax=Dehalogenimonas alkenigignens TaxID=1217799 RepID=A0A0W0GK76_9CHLR|nr:ATP-binding protein [Dehalogenimonas alkenigignens]KTB48951.1 Signal transduction histidine kinase [Dehalogenimonas alkenigignens]
MTLFKSVKFLLTIWYLFVLGALLLFFISISYVYLSNSLNSSFDDSLETTANNIRVNISIINGSPVLEENPTVFFETQSLELLMLFDASGTQLQVMGDAFTIPGLEGLLADATAENAVFATMNRPGREPTRIFLSPAAGDSNSGILLIGRSTASVSQVLDQLAVVHVIGGLITLLLAGAGGLFMANRALKPVDEMTRTAREISSTDLSRRIEVSANDELGKLAETLNQMIGRLDQSFTAQRRFTADASHELRTPAAIIQAESTLALSKSRNPEEYRSSLEVISRESEHMAGLIDKLLSVSRSDSGQPLKLEEIELDRLLKDLAEEFNPLCLSRQLACRIDRLEPVKVLGDRLELRRLFINLYDNAIRYTPPGGSVTLSAAIRDGFAEVSVTDTGIGIPKENLAHIFDRFYRVDKARSRAEGGSGLGLAICRQIAEAHGGRIEVKSEPGQGSNFTVLFPLSDKPDHSGLPLRP